MGVDPSACGASAQRFSGFADVYDRYRPGPPEILGAILTRLLRAPRPRLVVDVGSGTGLSTRYWAERADRVIGIEPAADMRGRAEESTEAPKISYREAYSHDTGLAEGCADIVTCSQSLHWMEPLPTFREARRILRPGGVFAAYDYDWPPATGCWEADAAYEECMERVRAMERDLPGRIAPLQWDKQGHLTRMRESGCFRYTREIVMHHEEQGSAERLVGLLLSQGAVQTLLRAGSSERDLGIDLLRRTATRVLGTEPQVWLWSSRLRVGVT